MARTDHRQVFDGAHLQAHLFGQGRRRLFVSFTYMEPGRSGFAVPKPVRRFIEAGLDHLQILTAQNDWYMNADLADLKAALPAIVAPYRRVFSMGFSMGGYAALALSRPLALDRAFLVSPQVTPFSDQPPFDRRYRRYADRLERALALSAADIRPQMRGFILFDPWHPSMDAAHARMISDMAPGMTALPFPFGGHPAAQMVQEAGMWGRLQDLLIDRKAGPSDLVALRRQARRGSAMYLSRLAEALAKRRGPIDEGFDQPEVSGFGNSLP